jgi:hypothetical protein
MGLMLTVCVFGVIRVLFSNSFTFVAPRGIEGGQDGKRGENFYYMNVNTAYQKKISLGIHLE